MRHLPFKAVTAAALICASSGLQAQAYPAKPIRIIVPYAQGGGPDVLGRLIAEKLTAAWGQPAVVENRTGAGSNIGTEIAANAAPDGYTFMVAGSPLSVNPSLYAKLPYDPIRSFAPVSMLATVPMVLTVHPSVPAASVKELIALAKSRPGQLTFATAGGGSPQHLAAEMLKSMAGIDLVHVPYKGAALAMPDVLAGRVAMFISPVNQMLPQIRTGKLRALGVVGLKRIATLPEVPTIDEAAVPGFETDVWIGFVAPAGTAPEIIDKMNSELVRMFQVPELKDRLSGQGIEIATSTPEQLATLIRTDLARWAKIIRAANIKLE